MAEHLVDALRRYAAHTPDAPALEFEATRLTFRQLHERSSRIANALTSAGVGRGDRVSILDKTSTTPMELFFACGLIGAIMMPLNWRLSPAEVAGILRDGTPSVIFVADELRHLLAEAPVVAATIGLGAAFEDWLGDADTRDPGVPHGPHDPVLLLYTSGTTGTPKGVMLTHESHGYSGEVAKAWDFNPASVNLVAMPLFHIGGLGYGMMGMSQGGHTVLIQQPDPALVMDLIERCRVTHALFVPTVIQALVEHAEQHPASLSSFRRMVYGAAPIGEELLRRAMSVFQCAFTHAYGLTESSGTVVTLQPEDHDPDGPLKSRLRSCGKALPWVELGLFDPATGKAVAPGDVGEIRLRTPMNMLGYWGKPDETAAAITPDGWLCTGDAAWQDADGYLYIHDRYKDMIVSGGENIYPAELENTLQSHPGIAEVSVIGTPHPRWGETPRAFVVARESAELTEAEVIAYTRARLATYKCPTSVVFVEALPRNASGKVLKREIRLMDEALRAAQGS